MKTKLRYSWDRAIRFDADFARKLSEIARKHYQFCHDQILRENGMNTVQYPDYESLKDIGNGINALKHYGLLDSLRRVNDITWDIKNTDNTELDNLTTDHVLSSPNNSRSRIVSATISNKSYDHRFSVSISENSLGGPIDIDVKGYPSEVKVIQMEISDLLESVKQPWWIARSGYVNWIFAIASFISSGTIFLAFESIKDNDKTAIDLLDFFTIIGAGMLMLTLLNRAWNWVFPMVEFYFGGGVKRSLIRRNARYALWSIPILGIILPYMVNHLR